MKKVFYVLIAIHMIVMSLVFIKVLFFQQIMDRNVLYLIAVTSIFLLATAQFIVEGGRKNFGLAQLFIGIILLMAIIAENW